MSGYADKISLLRERLSDVSRQLISLADKRRSYSLAASEGDAKARKEIADLDFQLDAVRKEEGTLGSALEIAQALARQEQADAAARSRHENAVEAHSLARALISLHEEIDLRLRQLREVFERRATVLAQLAATEAVDSLFVARLSNKAQATRATCAAGLHRFLSLETCAPQSMLPLSDGNAQLLSVGAPPDGKPKVRPRPLTMRH
jgi:hypothetical protein